MDKIGLVRQRERVTNELRLRPMTTEELPAYIARLEVEYAVELHESAGISLQAAKEESRQSTIESFPEGRVGPNEQVWVAEDATGSRVGVLWMAHREPGTPKEHAWIYDIEVDEARRGEGWGRKLLDLAEEQTRALGLTSLRLNVFGQNTIARELYRTQGFAESRVTMVKDVGTPLSTTGAGHPRSAAGDEPPTASLDIIR
jgi:ribosomal protein S18 acetylase RimI-like enzyme